ncbi:tyrosine-type recombinase/integrase [Tenacibaculum retecalamus]|nr:tyrosine-type recombinase/integrase [Tenacibaculum retecalamus]WBX70341.1 tyrosine-type recombinase/integrase [Tenacibaculum retecalamus]
MRGKRYSESTVLTYFTFIADFIDFSQPAPIESLTNKNVELFIEAVFIARDYSISSQRQFISALKLFVVYYPTCNIESLTLQRPKTSRKLPSVLSQQEVVTLLQVTRNLKHRAILAMLYSSGLRIGELTKLELRHIDVARRQLFVQNGKGRKDRYVILADSFLPLLQNYISTYVPKRFFVESPTGTKYSESSIRKFLHTSTRLAKIKKHVTPHTLRHSYATHLLENGIGLRHIQELLGHAKPETTMIYTHVAKKDLLEIKSPLDTILLSLQKNTSESEQFLNSRKN